MKRKIFIVGLAGICLLAAFVFLAVSAKDSKRRGQEGYVVASGDSRAPDGSAAAGRFDELLRLSSGEQSKFAAQQIKRVALQLEEADREGALLELKRLEELLFLLPEAVASGVILGILADGEIDATTGLPFRIGPEGDLQSAGALRVMLLDWLGRIDPQQAGRLAEKMLEGDPHPDEWAVCLRNYAWANPGPGSFPYLRSQALELLENGDLAASPTAGYLESFDVLVYTEATEAAPLLAALLSDDVPGSRATTHAAFLTLDRLVISKPEGMLKRLREDQQLVAQRGGMVAQMMARADVRDPAQKAELMRYLLDPGRRPDELEAFAEVYPNSNYMISGNLLTSTDVPDGAALLDHDRAALEVISEWAGQERFSTIRPYLERARARLEVFAPAGDDAPVFIRHKAPP